MAKAKAPVFTQVAPNEVKFVYKGITFMLVENSRGVLSIGSAIQLYQMNGMERTHIKEVGWTKSDNHSSRDMANALITTFTNMEECKVAAVKYIDQVL
jgi:hypothetical protein